MDEKAYQLGRDLAMLGCALNCLRHVLCGSISQPQARIVDDALRKLHRLQSILIDEKEALLERQGD